jgi:hypothetical protein
VVRIAPTFEEHIEILAAESPPAVVLDWWRRLDLTAHEHFALVHMRRPKNRHELEEHIAGFPGLGPSASAQISALRLQRNLVAHNDNASLTHDESISYAREAFDVIKDFQKSLAGLKYG